MASFDCGALRVPRTYTQLIWALSSAPWGSGLRLAWPFPGCWAHGPVSHLPPYRQDTPSLSTVYKWTPPPYVPGSEGRRGQEGLELDPRNFRSHDPSPQPPCMLLRWEGALLSRAATDLWFSDVPGKETEVEVQTVWAPTDLRSILNKLWKSE